MTEKCIMTAILNQHLDQEGAYADWIDQQEEYIIESYRESIETIDDVPEDYIEGLYQNWDEEDDIDPDALHDARE